MGSQFEVDLPEHIQAKKCCINIQNKDNRCFAYALTASKLRLQKDQPARAYLYLPEKNGIIEASEYPVTLHDIPKWERKNEININVFCLDDKKEQEVIPLKISKESFESTCDLLLHDNHYYWIKNFNRLCSADKKPCNHCRRCLRGYARKEDLANHQVECDDFEICKETMPSGDKTKMFIFPS